MDSIKLGQKTVSAGHLGYAFVVFATSKKKMNYIYIMNKCTHMNIHLYIYACTYICVYIHMDMCLCLRMDPYTHVFFYLYFIYLIHIVPYNSIKPVTDLIKLLLTHYY